MMQLNSAAVVKIINEHKKFFDTGKTKNVDFRIEQLGKLRQAIQANEELIITCTNPVMKRLPRKSGCFTPVSGSSPKT